MPRLVVMTGRPGAGKTTLTHLLSKRIRFPAICRDEIKEGLLRTEGVHLNASPEITRRTFDAFFETVQLLVDRRVSLVAEAAFQHSRWEMGLRPLFEKAEIRFVVCHIEAEWALARRVRRDTEDPERSQFHQDPFPTVAEPYDPPRFDRPTLVVDTTEGYDPSLEDIVEFCMRG